MKKSYVYPFLALALLVAFVLFKFPHLLLPYYWDEGWVYGPAVMHLYEAGVSFSPDVISTYYTRGHPLLFHVLAASWMNLFGATIFSTHCFALAISLVVLIATYSVCANYLSKKTGLLAMLILAVQPLFLAQSALVLPEMLLALCILLAIIFYALDKKLLYWLAAAAAIMTKESAIVLFATIGLYELILFMMSSTKNYIAFFKKCIIVVSPISVWLIFLVWQKQVNGWYFFPEHTGYISFDLSAIWNKTERYFSYLVFFQGRNSITVIMIVPIWFFIRNKKYSLENPMHRMLGLFSLFAVLFILFSSLNFYSDRYMLCTLPGFIISAVVVIEGYYKRLLLVVAFAAVAVGTYTSLYKKSISDHNLGYVEAVHVYQEAVNYMVANKLKKEPIYAYFLMKENLTNPYTGYVSKENAFLSVSDSYHPKVSRYFIASNTEGQEEFKKLKETVPMTLVKRFEKNHVWVALYKAVE